MRYCFLALILICCCTACDSKKSKVLNRRITLWRKDKIPYGTELAYDGLSQLFPRATVSVNKASVTSLTPESDHKAFISINSTISPRPSEINSLMNFVREGNYVFLSAHRYGDSLLHFLGLQQGWGHDQKEEPDSLSVQLYNPDSSFLQSYTYPGDSYDNWISSLDSQHTTVLGRDSRDRPNFIKLSYKNGGSIFLHFAPLAYSNFFILHKQNRAYYERSLSYIPSSVGEIVWDDSFRYTRDFSALQYILSSEPLRWAFWLLLLLFALIYIFDSKRLQRQIPEIAPLRNTSLDFVQTIGRLYFQRRDNHNLAVKMVNHFLDQVRTHYHMSVSALDEAFIDRLSYRTGYPREELSRLVGHMQALQGVAYLSDEDLMDFHRQLEAFYKSV
ncbi:MAG: hypothetical protein JST68_08015 [Bacteroidetes bacterium]|nr:hypothetical protein [Bacteroidota bacterium]